MSAAAGAGRAAGVAAAGGSAAGDASAPAAIAAAERSGSPLVVRPARPDEHAAVDRLIAEAYAHDYGESEDEHDDPMYAAAYRAREYDVWVAVDAAGGIVGSATTRRAGGPSLHEDFRDDELDLRLLGVASTARRRGIAAAIMRAVIAHAARDGFSAVILKTAPNMTGAHRLYEALGFVREPARDGLWIGGVRQFDLLTYRYPLAAAAA